MNVYGELTRAQLENRTSDPSLSSHTKGLMWYRTDLSTIKTDLGGSTDTLAFIAATQTLTNKTYDTASNTFKSGAATNGQALTADGSGGSSWASVATTISTVAKTANFTLTSSNDVVVADTSGGAFTLTLPAAASNLKRFKIVLWKVDTSFANALSIARTGSDTFVGGGLTGLTSTKLFTVGEILELDSDGTSVWYITRTIPSAWVAYTPGTIGAGWGTTSSSEFYWKRVGDSIFIKGWFTAGTIAASSCRIQFPTGLALDTSKFANQYPVGTLGNGTAHSATVVVNAGHLNVDSYLTFGGYNSTGGGLADTNGTTLPLTSGDTVAFCVGPIPITAWTG